MGGAILVHRTVLQRQDHAGDGRRGPTAPAAAVEILDADDLRQAFVSRPGVYEKRSRTERVADRLHRAPAGASRRVCDRRGDFALGQHARRNRVAAIDGIPFVEVFLDSDLQCLIDRDVKGLDKRAPAGELTNFTGILRSLRGSGARRDRASDGSRAARREHTEDLHRARRARSGGEVDARSDVERLNRVIESRQNRLSMALRMQLDAVRLEPNLLR